MTASLDDLATNGKLINTSIAGINQTLRTLFPRVMGSFTLANAATTTIPQPAVTANCVISTPIPTNAAAATLMGSNKSLYISAKTAGTGFTVATASGVAAAGSETFDYYIVVPV